MRVLGRDDDDDVMMLIVIVVSSYGVPAGARRKESSVRKGLSILVKRWRGVREWRGSR